MKMSAARKKSSTSTDDSSSTTSSGSSSSSGTSSGSDSVSSSSESDTSSTVEEKTQNQSKGNDSTVQKTNVNTRRKSSEVKTGGKVAESDKNSALLPTTKTRSTNASQRYTKSNDLSSEDEIPPKKPTRLLNINNSQRQKKPQLSSNQPFLNGGSGGGKAPPAVVKQHHQQNLSAKTPPNKINSSNIKGDDEHAKDNLNFSSVVSSENSENDFQENKKLEKKSVTKPCSIGKSSSAKVKPMVSRIHQKRSATAKSNSRAKSTDESESESGSSLGDGSTSTTESEQTESSNTSVSITQKKPRSKRVSDQNLDVLDETKSRNPTRSLNTRRTKHISGRVGGTISDSDSEVDANNEKFNPKIPTKKMATNSITTKAKTKKDCIDEKPRLPSPQPIIEKKCPIEGCDSSGHLSGNQDKHFLAEACPIYHNMSASECKERANERRQRAEFRQRILSSQQHSSKKIITPEQKEYLSKIRESRARFRPIMGILNSEKIKVEKDCPDDDREPSLSGLVPDYDLQLFREAQAIASEKIEEELMDLPVGKGIRYITMGKYKMKVWYQSPYPDDAARLPKMYICEFCLRYQKSETGIKRHAQKCVWRHPPGDEIYRKGKLQVWQVDGKRHKQYCQHLCLLAKFFLDHKTLYYDVEPFLFYIMTLADVDGCHTVGYFSKEKNSFYNVSCILTLPPYQRKGYGRLLIDFSYLLTRVEGKIGSPEKPLSDLGLISYRSYWKDVLLDYLCNRSGSTLSIKDVSQEMAIYSYDIVSTLQALGMMKYWKGKHIVLKKQDVLDEYEERVKRRGNFPKIDDSCLRWSPFVPPQTNASP